MLGSQRGRSAPNDKVRSAPRLDDGRLTAPKHLASRASSTPPRRDSQLWEHVAFPLGVWVLWRAAHAVLVVAFGGNLVDATFHFDGGWLRSVLENGYVVTDRSFGTQQNPAFMPGVAWLAWPFAQVIGVEAAALLVANVTGLAAFYGIYGATRSWASVRTAQIATVALALWPTSFVLWAYYSEGLFIAATALGLWADQRDRPAPALLACVLVSLTRTVGIAFAPVLALARWWRLGRLDAVGAGYLVSGAAATVAVSVAQDSQIGDPLAWVHAQQAWGRGISPPWSPLISAVSEVVEKLPRPALELSLNLIAIAVASVGAVIMIRWWRQGTMPTSVVAWTVIAIVLPLCSVVISSQARFVLGAWPAFAAFAYDRREARGVRLCAAVAGSVLSVLLVRRWAQSIWVA